MRLLATAILTVVLAAAGGAATVRMLEKAVVEGTKVTLSDVATVETSNSQERERLAAVVVAFAADNEGGIRVDSHAVRQALSDAGVNVAKVNVVGARWTEVSRKGGSGRTAKLAGAIEKYLAATMPKKNFLLSEISAGFTASPELDPVVAAARPDTLEGRVRFDIADARDGGKVVGSVFATVTRTVAAVVAKRRMAAGAMIRAEDVEVRHVTAFGASEAVAEAKVAVGQRLNRAVDAGAPVTRTMLDGEDVVRRNDEVTLEYRKGGLVVSTKAKALENAAVGDVVRLQTGSGRKEQFGKIVGPGRAAPATGGEE